MHLQAYGPYYSELLNNSAGSILNPFGLAEAGARAQKMEQEPKPRPWAHGAVWP